MKQMITRIFILCVIAMSMLFSACGISNIALDEIPARVATPDAPTTPDAPMVEPIKFLTKQEIKLWFDNFEYDEQFWANSTDGNYQAWSYAYLQNARFEMYKQTGELDYLVKMANGIAMTIESAYAPNPNHPENVGWPTKNPSFVPQRIHDERFNDSQIVTLNSNDIITLTADEYSPDQPYSFEFDVMTYNSNARVYVWNETKDEEIPLLDGNVFEFNHIAWQRHEIRFVTPIDETDIITINIVAECNNNDYGIVNIKSPSLLMLAMYYGHDMPICVPISKFIAEVYSNETLAEQEYFYGITFKDIAEKYLEFVIQILNKNEDLYDEEHYVYRFPNNDSAKNYGVGFYAVPHNYNLAGSIVLLNLYSATSDEFYLDRAVELLSYFKSTMKTFVNQYGESYYHWVYYNAIVDNDEWFTAQEWMSHASIEISAVINAYEFGVVFDENDMIKLANSYKQYYWNGDIENPNFYCYEDGGLLTDTRVLILLSQWNADISIAINTYISQNIGLLSYENVNTYYHSTMVLVTLAYLYRFCE